MFLRKLVHTRGMIPIRFYSDDKAWCSEFVDLCVSNIEVGQNEGRQPVICLAGGSTPFQLYESLCQALVKGHSGNALPVTAFVSDERWEPDNPALQNGPLIRSVFQPALDIGAMEIVGWNLETTPEQACARMLESLGFHLGTNRSFDFACLGLGPDGHTAGLFELIGAPVEAARYRAPLPPHNRLSLSANLLSRSKTTCFVLKLAGKEEAVTSLFHGDASISATAAASADSSMHILCR